MCSFICEIGNPTKYDPKYDGPDINSLPREPARKQPQRKGDLIMSDLF